jgi:hypothetical protein
VPVPVPVPVLTPVLPLDAISRAGIWSDLARDTSRKARKGFIFRFGTVVRLMHCSRAIGHSRAAHSVRSAIRAIQERRLRAQTQPAFSAG